MTQTGRIASAGSTWNEGVNADDLVKTPSEAKEPQSGADGTRAIKGYDQTDTFEAGTGSIGGSRQLPGGAIASGQVSGPSFSATETVSASADEKGIHFDAEISVDADAASANGKVTKTFEVEVGGQKLDVTLTLDLKGKIGADGKLHVEVNIGPGGVNAKGGASGFAGATGTIGVSAEVDHVTADGNREVGKASLEASGTAGVAGQAKADVGYDDGKIHFEDAEGAAFGVGGEIEVTGEADLDEAAEVGQEVLGNLAEQGVDWAGQELSDFGSALEGEGYDLLQGTKDVLESGWKGTEKIVGSGAKKVKDVLGGIF